MSEDKKNTITVEYTKTTSLGHRSVVETARCTVPITMKGSEEQAEDMLRMLQRCIEEDATGKFMNGTTAFCVSETK